MDTTICWHRLPLIKFDCKKVKPEVWVRSAPVDSLGMAETLTYSTCSKLLILQTETTHSIAIEKCNQIMNKINFFL